MTQPTAEQRAIYERTGRAVHAFVATGVTPLLSAAGAAASSDPLSRSAAVVALRANPTTRIALDGAFTSVRGAYNEARAAWQAGNYAAAVERMEGARAACERLYRQMVDAVPRVQDILGRLAANLASAPLEGLGAGLGMAAAVLMLGAVLVLAGGK